MIDTACLEVVLERDSTLDFVRLDEVVENFAHEKRRAAACLSLPAQMIREHQYARERVGRMASLFAAELIVKIEPPDHAAQADSGMTRSRSSYCVPWRARAMGTRYEARASCYSGISLGCMIRWLDFNDQFSGKQGSHPSDTLAGILMLADHLSRQRKAGGRAPLLMREVLDDLIKAYEIQVESRSRTTSRQAVSFIIC